MNIVQESIKCFNPINIFLHMKMIKRIVHPSSQFIRFCETYLPRNSFMNVSPTFSLWLSGDVFRTWLWSQKQQSKWSFIQLKQDWDNYNSLFHVKVVYLKYATSKIIICTTFTFYNKLFGIIPLYLIQIHIVIMYHYHNTFI